MLPSRCPHCQAELPKLGRFCVMCGRRVEGWRGLMPAGDPDLGDAEAGEAGKSGDRHGADDSEAPRAVSGQEDQTRPVRPSRNLAAAALPDDAESRKPTGEVPSIGHELRAKAPNQRVHTSPIGNVLPSDVLETLDEAIAANSSRSGQPGDSSRADRTPSSPIRQSEAGKRERAGDRGLGESRADRSGRRRSLKPRHHRSEFPAVTPPTADPAGASSNDSHRDRPPRAANAPHLVGAEPTHFIPRRPSSARILGVLRTLIWALLWLGMGGMVAFSVVVLYRRSHPPLLTPTPGTPVRVSPPPRRPPPIAPKAAPAAARPALSGSTAPPSSPTQARDLVVPIPAGALPLGPPTYSAPALRLPPTPGVTPPTALPAPPAPPLDPKQRAAAEQTMSNIEFVVSERVAQMRACYDRAVRSAGTDAPAGRVEVALTLTDEGLVQSVVTIGNTVGSPLLSGCLEQRIAEWRFPRPLGTERTFRLPFTFSPSPEQSGPRPKR